jgi:FtsP/CotA-like multicopper oxidase with cupredoxin domain
MLSLVVLWLTFAVYAAAVSSSYTLELAWRIGSPDGFEREMIFVNEQFPGPLLEIQQDDWVEITVINKLPFNTTLHAHGTHYLQTPMPILG